MSELYHTDQTPQPRRVKNFPLAKPGYKYCVDCEEEKAFDQFSVRNGIPFSYCYECCRKRDRNRSQGRVKKERQYAPRKSMNAIYTRDGYKVCPSCEKELLLEAFPLRDGKHVGSCIECTRAKDRERNRLRRPTNNPRKRKEDVPLPTKILPTQQCSSCGEIKPFPAFELLRHSHEERYSECRECAEKRRVNSIKQRSMFTKVCPCCGIEKWLETEYTFSSTRKRYSFSCRDCEQQRRLRLYKKRLDKIKAYNLKRQSNPRYIEYHRQKERERYYTIPGVKLQYLEMSKRHKAKKRGTRTEKVSYKYIIERDDYYCYICCKDIDPLIKSGPGKLVFDHKIPLNPRPGEPQGTHTTENIYSTHQICNARKSNKPFHLLTALDRQGL